MDTTDPSVIDPNGPYAELQEEVMNDYLRGYTITPELLREISPIPYASSGDAPLLAVHMSMTNWLLSSTRKKWWMLTKVGVRLKLEPFQEGVMPMGSPDFPPRKAAGVELAGCVSCHLPPDQWVSAYSHSYPYYHSR
jgi:hypothetical protein